jgi:uncharacterized protein YutE (UPF0331/DUF86 family)
VNEQEAMQRATLERLSEKWAKQGYQVFIEPRGEIVPSFLQRYLPDAILVRDDDKVIVEAIRKGQRNAEEKVKQLKALIEGQHAWRLEIVYSGEEVDSMRQVDRRVIADTLSSAIRLSQAEPRAALLLLWASTEAAARVLFPSQTNRPQSPGRVIELLAGNGEVTPSEAQVLRNLMQARNRIVHGELDVALDLNSLMTMHDIVKRLLEGNASAQEADVQH